MASLLLARAGPRTPTARVAEPPVPVLGDPQTRAQRLGVALTFATVSGEAGRRDEAAFAGFRSFLESSFPRVHATLTRELVGGGTLLYRWEGSDPRAPSILLMGHYDVVPVEPGSESRWTHPPFAGVVAHGAAWGRGAVDDKAAVLGMLEAVEELLKRGYRPDRTLYLSFGHDEEVGGADGAARIARLLAERGARPELVLDEGMVIVEPLLPGLERPVALVGIAEKGFLSVELTTRASGGHSSVPPRNTAVGILAAAVARLEANPLSSSLEGPTRMMLEALAPELPIQSRVVLRNLWLFGPWVRHRLAAHPETDAATRTTAAATLFEGGTQPNMLPGSARALVNYRIRPGQTVEDVLAHVRTTIADDRVQVRRLGVAGGDPTPRSATDSRAWAILERTIRQVFPDVVVAPFLALGSTDARHLVGVGGDVYRFLPLRSGHAREGEGPHGADERIRLADYETMVGFYSQLIRNATGGAASPSTAPASR